MNDATEKLHELANTPERGAPRKAGPFRFVRAKRSGPNPPIAEGSRGVLWSFCVGDGEKTTPPFLMEPCPPDAEKGKKSKVVKDKVWNSQNGREKKKIISRFVR